MAHHLPILLICLFCARQMTSGHVSSSVRRLCPLQILYIISFFSVFGHFIVLVVLLTGSMIGLHYIRGFTDADLGPWPLWDSFVYLFILTVSAGDFEVFLQKSLTTRPIWYLGRNIMILNVQDEEAHIAQIYTIIYVVFAAILMMNLLIALMSTTYDEIYSSGKNASAFGMLLNGLLSDSLSIYFLFRYTAFAESTYDFSQQSRFMPAPIGLYVLIIAFIVHVVNFFFAIIAPSAMNVYLIVNHYQYTGLVCKICIDF